MRRAASSTSTSQRGLLDRSPFESLDTPGVGALVEIAVKRGRETRPDLRLGICGEHGGDPESIRFFERVGLDYVSCSPYRVPIARVAAAQAALADGRTAGEHRSGRPAPRERFVRLCETPSPTGFERAVADDVLAELRGLGVEVVRGRRRRARRGPGPAT